MAMYYEYWPKEEEPIDESTYDELKSMLQQVLDVHQKCTNDIIVKLDNLSGKLDTYLSHEEKLDTQTAEFTEYVKIQEESHEPKKVYNYWPQEEESFEESIQCKLYEEPPFDESVFTPEQKVELDILCKEHNPILTRSELAIILQMNIEDRESTLEGKVSTISDSMEAHAPKEVSSSMNTSMLIDDCYTLIDLTENLDTLKFETFPGKYNKVGLDIDYPHTLIDHDDKLSIYEESSLLLEKSNLGDVLDVDEILNEIDNPKVEIDYRKEDVVFYTDDGDEVDYVFMNSFEHKVDLVFPSHSFGPHVHLNIKEEFKLYATIVVIVLDFSFSTLLWKTVCLFACFVSCLSRRRTKGALAQPFDTYD